MNSRRSLIITVGVLLVFFILCIGEAWIVQTIGLLLFGWASYLKRVIPQVQLNYSAVALFVIMLPIAILMTHAMLKWLWNGLGNQVKWKWKWTGMSLSILMLLFFTGMAATGIAHQTGWLINSPKPLVKSSYSGRHPVNRIKCASNLRQLGYALALYRESHTGFNPRDLNDWIDVAFEYEIDSNLFICSADDLDKAPATQPAELRQQLLTQSDLYISFAIAPANTRGPEGKIVLLYDKTIDNHEDGLNLLYDDGTTEWLDEDEALAFLNRVQPTATTRESYSK